MTNYGKTVDEAVVDITLLDQDGKQVAFISDVVKDIRKGQETINTASVEVKNPRLWSAETPYLYTAILELKDKTGKTLEAMSSQFGFRKIEIKNKRVYINNEQVFFKGANRHDIHPQHGKAVPVESMIEDILLFKRCQDVRITRLLWPLRDGRSRYRVSRQPFDQQQGKLVTRLCRPYGSHGRA